MVINHLLTGMILQVPIRRGVVHPVYMFNSILRNSKPLLICSCSHQKASAKHHAVFHHLSPPINGLYEHHWKTVDETTILTPCRCHPSISRHRCSQHKEVELRLTFLKSSHTKKLLKGQSRDCPCTAFLLTFICFFDVSKKWPKNIFPNGGGFSCS